MAQPYLGEVRVFPFNFAPRGWAICNGQLLSISQNQALFSILGVTYGGNGVTTFALPNLQGRMPIHPGNGFELGATGGEANHTLITDEMPAHIHTAQGNSSVATLVPPTTAIWATSTDNPYTSATNTTLSPNSLATAGGGLPHNNMPPFLALNFCIALGGVFPSRN